MSEVAKLRSQLHEVSTDAKRVGDSLAEFKQKFSQQSGQVQALIAGTASGADRAIMETLNAASGSLNDAVANLHAAAGSCRDYADQI